jgi:glycerophosphoryl diester phosphodiesterase
LEIPTLEEVIRHYRQRANYYIETKNPYAADAMEERLVTLLDEYNLLRPATGRAQVLVQSFNPDSLLRLQVLEPELPLIQLFSSGETSESIQVRLDAVGQYAVGIGPSKTDVDAVLVQAAHAHGLHIHPYTLEGHDEIRTLINLGVDGMSVNFPARMADVLFRPGTR